MAMDYDLWWKLFKRSARRRTCPSTSRSTASIAARRPRRKRVQHYREAMSVVRKYHGSVPLKWYLAQPYAVWWRTFIGR
jgi:hypothetical protein